MERRVADILNAATSRFYAQQALSFSQTRQSAWPGWERCLSYLDELAAARSLSLVDIGCGNLRFEAFLKAARPYLAVELTAVDNGLALFEQARPGIFDDVRSGGSFDDAAGGDGGCSGGSLAAPSSRMRLATFQDIDVIAQALNRESLLGFNLGESADVVLCFGFMHHVPGCETREFALREMLKLLRPGGILAVSFWQFMKSVKLAEQAEQLREQALSDLQLAGADLEKGDHLLGWQKVPGVYRYCHSFGEAELDSLAGALSDLAKLEAHFEADGHTGNLNAYLILRRK